MIDEDRMKVEIEDMRNAALNSLLQAVDLDRKLTEHYGTHIKTNYNPQISGMSVYVSRDLELNKIVRFIKDSVPYPMKGESHFGKKNDVQGYRLGGKSGFSVVVVTVPLSAMDPRYFIKNKEA